MINDCAGKWANDFSVENYEKEFPEFEDEWVSHTTMIS